MNGIDVDSILSRWVWLRIKTDEISCPNAWSDTLFLPKPFHFLPKTLPSNKLINRWEYTALIKIKKNDNFTESAPTKNLSSE